MSPDAARRPRGPATGEDRYDLAVVGAGSAGFAAALRAAELGARVALVGRGPLGGTCVNDGCVPSKTLLRAADALHGAAAAGRFAGLAGAARLEDWSSLRAQKDELVARLRRARYAVPLAAHDGIDYLEGAARFAAEGLTVDGAPLRADKVVLATGARPAVPGIPGLAEAPYLTSAEALALDALPASLLVLGGGYVGCELAQLFARTGVAVTIACRSRLLPEAEPEVSQALAGCLTAEGIAVRTGLAYRAVRATDRGIALDVQADGAAESLQAERLLVAAGRRPDTGDLGLAAAGIACGDDGAVRVDERLRTSRPGVYAAGDVTGRHQFVYMAAYGAKLAAENALTGDRRRYEAVGMPWVVFTDPQAAGAGLTEAEAAAADYRVRTATLGLEHVPRALAARDTRGLIKLVAEAGSGRLLGAHVLAPEGGEAIQSAVLAIRQGMTAEELGETVFPYLTTVEGLRLAAQSFRRDPALLSCCAG